MKIALCQINPVIGDFAHQYQLIVSAVERAKARGCDLAIFPELALCGYPPRDLLEQHAFVEAGRRCLDRLVATISGIGVIVGFTEANPGPTGNALFNAAALFEDGKILSTARKQLLPSYDVFDERRYFEPGTSGEVIEYKHHPMGITICEDAWNDKEIFKRPMYAPDPVAPTGRRRGRPDRQYFRVPRFIGANPGSATPCSPRRRASTALPWCLSIRWGATITSFSTVPVRYMMPGGTRWPVPLISAKIWWFSIRRAAPGSKCAPLSGDIEAVLQALIMGTRDYVTKCGFRKVVVGLSGGIDSALTVYVAVQAPGC